MVEYIFLINLFEYINVANIFYKSSQNLLRILYIATLFFTTEGVYNMQK
jgi:hypothetical protein